MSNQCEATANSGEQCRSPALRGGRYCFWHEPSLAPQAEDARRRGGLNRAGRDDPRDLVARTMTRLERGQVEHEAALAMAELGKAYAALGQPASDDQPERGS